MVGHFIKSFWGGFCLLLENLSDEREGETTGRGREILDCVGDQ